MLIRSYTSKRPVIGKEQDEMPDFVVAIYFPDERKLGGTMSSIHGCMPLGEEIEIRKPTGEIAYWSSGKLITEGKEM
jgi:nitrate reductase (NAD(P)H)